jgi:hypothetical protein
MKVKYMFFMPFLHFETRSFCIYTLFYDFCSDSIEILILEVCNDGPWILHMWNFKLYIVWLLCNTTWTLHFNEV